MKGKSRSVDFKMFAEGPLRYATLCFLLRDDQVLLAMKKRGFAVGKWNGVGGKMDKRDESIASAATREVDEEIGVTPTSMQEMAIINFYHQDDSASGMSVTVYLCREWEGVPTESEEMAPKWFNVNEIPYDDMWEDDKYWLPMILNGKIVEGDFLFDENQKMVVHDLRKIHDK